MSKSFPQLSLHDVESVKLSRQDAGCVEQAETKWLRIEILTRDDIEFSIICHESGGPPIKIFDEEGHSIMNKVEVTK